MLRVHSVPLPPHKSRPTHTYGWKRFWKRQIKTNRDGTYTNFLIYEMPSEFNLLGNSSDCEYSHTRVCVWRWVSLELHVSSWLLIYALDVLTTWREENQGRIFSIFFHKSITTFMAHSHLDTAEHCLEQHGAASANTELISWRPASSQSLNEICLTKASANTTMVRFFFWKLTQLTDQLHSTGEIKG